MILKFQTPEHYFYVKPKFLRMDLNPFISKPSNTYWDIMNSTCIIYFENSQENFVISYKNRKFLNSNSLLPRTENSLRGGVFIANQQKKGHQKRSCGQTRQKFLASSISFNNLNGFQFSPWSWSSCHAGSQID